LNNTSKYHSLKKEKGKKEKENTSHYGQTT